MTHAAGETIEKKVKVQESSGLSQKSYSLIALDLFHSCPVRAGWLKQ